MFQYNPNASVEEFEDRYQPSPPEPVFERRVGYTGGCPIYLLPKYKTKGKFIYTL
jgi:hypothetical protein